MSISKEEVIWAYRILLSREPENESVVSHYIENIETLNDLRDSIINSEEFRQNFLPKSLTMTGFEPRIDAEIDSELSETDLNNLFADVQSTWTKVGNENPFWGVLSHEKYKDKSLDTIQENYYNSSSYDIERIKKTLIRNSLNMPKEGLAIEYGCGVGRTTHNLAKEFKNVIGVDISKSMLEVASNYIEENDIDNIDFFHLTSIKDVSQLPTSDFFYSMIVLQHSPPPVISYMIKNAIKNLKPGGIGIFQVPVYIPNYKFIAKEYLGKDQNIKDSFKCSHQQYDIHAIKMKSLFSIIVKSNATLIEVLEDGFLGGEYKDSMSITCVIQKN